jgi:RNA recognition motif-containing protein
MKKIYVGNLPRSTTEMELRNFFEAHGAVEKITLVTDRDTGRSPGFGFVEMANASEADKAIAALNGTDVGGRTLTVNQAIPEPEWRCNGGVRLPDVVCQSSPKRSSRDSREKSYPVVACRWETLARMVVEEEDPERLTILLANLDLALLPSVEFRRATSAVGHTALVHGIKTRLSSHDRCNSHDPDCVRFDQRHEIRVEQRKYDGTPDGVHTSPQAKRDGFLILRRGRDTAPSLAGCIRCELKFFTPRSLMDAPSGALQYLLSKFAAHNCSYDQHSKEVGSKKVVWENAYGNLL